jgi:hypothetical protein
MVCSEHAQRAGEVQSGICPRSPCTNPWNWPDLLARRPCLRMEEFRTDEPRLNKPARGLAATHLTCWHRPSSLLQTVDRKGPTAAGGRASEPATPVRMHFAHQSLPKGVPRSCGWLVRWYACLSLRHVSAAPQKCSACEKGTRPRRSLIVLPGFVRGACRVARQTARTGKRFVSDSRHETIL